MSCRSWLLESKYEDFLELTYRVEERNRVGGKKTRRSWYEAFAGDKHGNPRTIAGITFPIIKAIRKREGFPPCKNSIERRKGEKAPPKKPSGRWLA